MCQPFDNFEDFWRAWHDSKRIAARSDRLVRSYHLKFQPIVFIQLYGGPPVANCTTLHNRAGLNPAKVRQRQPAG